MASIYLTKPLLSGRHYHVFKPTSHEGPIFYAPNNYLFFLKRIQLILSPMVDVMGYCLMPSDIHLVFAIKDVITIKEEYVDHPEDIGHFVSEGLRKLFSTYTQTIQKQESLPQEEIVLDQNFYRCEIFDDDTLKQVLCAVNQLPQQTGLTGSFKQYEYSSYPAHSAGSRSIADREAVYSIFGSRELFVESHETLINLNTWPLFNIKD